ncbi:MAG TPA: imidazole glycerol phosphate synthase subunit HisH [Myxococcaceae bacterium]|nr:imidazole glycerol phosphate synthase subunit HisH [Myxococcaceae bacterium]
MRVAVLDTRVGNVHSLLKALTAAGAEPHLESRPEACLDAPMLVLPGVGAYPAATTLLAETRQAVRERLLGGAPCLGICLGMQLLLEGSEEGPGAGLGVVPGRVVRLEAPRVPHMGWNQLEGDDPLLTRSGLRTAYYAHSFVCRPVDPDVVRATTEHAGVRFPAMIRSRGMVGVQFHPEKSGAPGLAFLAAVLEEVGT